MPIDELYEDYIERIRMEKYGITSWPVVLEVDTIMYVWDFTKLNQDSYQQKGPNNWEIVKSISIRIFLILAQKGYLLV